LSEREYFSVYLNIFKKEKRKQSLKIFVYRLVVSDYLNNI